MLSELAKQGGKDPPEWPASKGWVMSLVEDHWQFILLQNGEEELFDLRTDPGDLTNLAGQAGSAQQLGGSAPALRNWYRTSERSLHAATQVLPLQPNRPSPETWTFWQP